MNLELKNHVAIVQGASKGIGLGVAHSLALEGCDLVLTARTAGPLEAAAEQLRGETGRRVETFAADSADLARLGQLVPFVESRFGRLDILVSNSGGPPPGGLRDLTPEQWRAAAELLFVAPTALLRSAPSLLAKSPAPRFFVITSSSTITPVSGLTLSNTFRPGLVGLIKTLTEELAGDRVCCHSIAPGRFDTDRLAEVFKIQAAKSGRTPDAVKADALKAIPAGRLGNPMEIGDLVAFLSSPRAEYLRGGNWLVDGGLIRVV